MFGLFERKAAPSGVSVADPALLSLFGAVGTPAASGISVGPESALRNSVAFASMKIIAETLATIEPRLYQRKGQDDHERVWLPSWPPSLRKPSGWPRAPRSSTAMVCCARPGS